MSFDGFFTYKVVQELRDWLVGGRIVKVTQPFAQELVLHIRAQRQMHYVLLSAHPSYCRLQCLESKMAHKDGAHRFGTILRKKIEGGVVRDIQQLQLDRVVIWTINKRDELGDEQSFHLICELMGRHSNICLLDANKQLIIDCLKHVPVSQNSFRLLRPGAQYQWPPHQERRNPMTWEETAADEVPEAEQLMHFFQGFGADSAAQLRYQMSSQNIGLSEALQQFVHQVQQGPPTLDTLTSGKQRFTPFPFADQSVRHREFFDTYSALLTAYYADKAEHDRMQQISGHLLQLVQRELHKNEEKYHKLQQELTANSQADLLRIKGELLTSYGAQVQTDDNRSVTQLPNFYDNERLLSIELDPRKSIHQNAQQYFKKYQKAKNSVRHLQEQIARAHQEIAYLDSVLTQLQLNKGQQIDDVREELIASGYLKRRQSPKRTHKNGKEKPQFLRFKASDGTRILVGRNNIQNDYLTLKHARKNHIWLHTKDIPGSHVVIESEAPTRETLYEAAQLAAYYSKFQTSANVPVDYVAIKHVRKPNGAKPGYVIYDNQKTLLVTPEKSAVDGLRD